MSFNYLFKEVIKTIKEIGENTNIQYEIIYTSKKDSCFHFDGGIVYIGNEGKYGISIQTSTIVTWGSYCETALVKKEKGIIYNKKLKYHDVLRFSDNQTFKEHMEEMFIKLSNVTDELNDNENHTI